MTLPFCSAIKIYRFADEHRFSGKCRSNATLFLCLSPLRFKIRPLRSAHPVNPVQNLLSSMGAESQHSVKNLLCFHPAMPTAVIEADWLKT